MKDFTGRVAVVTGGASGIGRAIAERFAAEGMRVVIADVEPGALRATVEEMTDRGAHVIGIPTDVSSPESLENLAARTIDAFGAVHILCNNAGVEGGALFPDLEQRTWEWVMGVNFWGVINGTRIFLPHLLAADEAHIVNTASHAAFATGLPTFHPYIASKAAVAAATENLALEFAATHPNIGVSLLVPGMVKTRMNASERNRPSDVPATDADAMRQAIHADIERATAAHGLEPESVAELVLEGIRERRFWLLTHPELTLDAVRSELAWMAGGEPPRGPMAEDSERLGGGPR